MSEHIKKGFSFGLASGVITTLGLIVGLEAGTGSRLVVIGGILVIAIADAMSDALGIHLSEESSGLQSHKNVWRVTIATFLSKFFFALTFVIPIILFELQTAIIVSVIYGLALIGAFSFYMGKQQDNKPWHTTFEHLFIAIVVIVITHYVGHWVALLG
ncbi:MAG: VIT1/CCC1 transporter family protein [Candidatus Komeilibacteria bacterium]